ncbi:MAG: cyclopropane-fatty-acyl-phospholipid synthase family protein, partial [Vicinamibacterales bacterium]
MRAPFRLPVLAGLLVAALVSARPAPAQVRGLDIHYVPTPPEVVDAMLALAKVGPGDVVYDLGSGDGRIPIEAARRHGATGVGIELDPSLVKLAKAGAEAAGVGKRVQFRQADIFKTDLSKASVVTLYLSPTTNLRLRDKLRRELAPGSRVVSHRFDMGDWMPDEERNVNGIRVFL